MSIFESIASIVNHNKRYDCVLWKMQDTIYLRPIHGSFNYFRFGFITWFLIFYSYLPTIFFGIAEESLRRIWLIHFLKRHKMSGLL